MALALRHSGSRWSSIGEFLLCNAFVASLDAPPWTSDTAMSALHRLDVSTVEIGKDILRPAEEAARSQSASTGLWCLLVIFEGRHRTRTGLGLFILGMVQLCGIDGITMYVVSKELRLLFPCLLLSFLPQTSPIHVIRH